MSSFLVSDACINRIVSFLYWDNNEYYSEMWRRKLQDIGYDLTDDDSVQSRPETFLGRGLLKVNMKAINIRYPGSHKNLKNPPYIYNSRTVTIYQALKSMECWLYQCSEGAAEKEPLYKFIHGVIQDVRSIIINKIPEYEKAEWG